MELAPTFVELLLYPLHMIYDNVMVCGGSVEVYESTASQRLTIQTSRFEFVQT